MSSKIVHFIARLILGNNPFVSFKFPKTIEGFGYKFNADGKLRKIDQSTGEVGTEPFEFNKRPDDRYYNQKHYEALGEAIDEYVYGMLLEMGFQKLPVPIDATPKEPQTFIFASPGFQEDEDKPLLILLQGSGVVRAGQWARSLIINDSLHTGTQVEYIKKAQELGYNILILNPNDVLRDVKGKKEFIRLSSSPEDHMTHVWDNYIMPAKTKKIAIVAHSYGGICVLSLSWDRLEDMEERVFAIGMTDSVHFGAKPQNEEEERANSFLNEVGRNWARSKKPLDTPLSKKAEEICCVSAGHPKHEMTSASAINSVFEFLEKRRRGEPTPRVFSLPSAETDSPTQKDSPVKMDSPTAKDSPVKMDSPTKDSPAKMDSPTMKDSPGKMDSPMKKDSPAKMDSPTKDSPTKMDSPTAKDSPVKMDSPTKDSPTKMDSPTMKDSLAKMDSPIENYYPAKMNSPMKLESPAKQDSSTNIESSSPKSTDQASPEREKSPSHPQQVEEKSTPTPSTTSSPEAKKPRTQEGEEALSTDAPGQTETVTETPMETIPGEQVKTEDTKTTSDELKQEL